MDFLRGLIEDVQQNDGIDVSSKVKAANKNADHRTNTRGFALENEDGTIVKVFVQAEQADDFERVLSRTLYNDENGATKEIPEVLFELRKNFDIVDVDWGEGAIPEDEEVEQEVTADEGDIDADLEADVELDLDVDAEGENGDLEMDASIDTNNDADAYSALDKVIDAMKADSEAKTAEAEAEKAKYESELARESLRAAEYRAAQEEEILDMEQYNKESDEVKKVADTREKLIKYRHDLKNNNSLGESMKYPSATPEEEEVFDMEDWEKREKKKKEHNSTRDRLNKFRHKKKGLAVRSEDEEELVNIKQIKGSKYATDNLGKGEKFCAADKSKGTGIDSKAKAPQEKGTKYTTDNLGKGESFEKSDKSRSTPTDDVVCKAIKRSKLSSRKAKGSVKNKKNYFEKTPYFGESAEIKEMTFLDFKKKVSEQETK